MRENDGHLDREFRDLRWIAGNIEARRRLAWARLRRSSADNRRDYRDVVLWTGIVGAILWPAYGWFCQGALGLEDIMPLRYALSGATLLLWARALWKPDGSWDRWIWPVISMAGLGWLPWHLYFANHGDSYWQMSVVFFAMAFTVAIRGVDLIFAIPLVAGCVAATEWESFDKSMVPLLAVVLITLWVAATGMHVLRDAQRRIQEQTRVLTRQNERLKELDRNKDEFTANVAHDLRTPLAVALSLVEDMSRSGLSVAEERRVGSLGEALRQMRRQSEELLDFQRFQLGVARLDRRDVDLGGWLARFEEGFTSMAHSRGLTFQVVLPGGGVDLVARVDPVRLETALFNLVSNAFKFTNSGGHVEVHLRRHGVSGIAIAVMDDGEGIPVDALERIFERFQQVDRGPGTYTAGVGIGLSLVKEIAEAHGGHVTVQSTRGLGSLFEIVLPEVVQQALPQALELSPSQEHQGLVAAVRPPSAGFLALVAEDEQLLRHVLHDVLERVAKVATAKDGREALRLVHELNPDILVTDYSMPGMDGMQLLAALRADPSTRDLPVVLLTGDPVSLRTRLAEEPTLAIMGKPFEQAELLSLVQGFLESSRMAGVA